MVINGRNKTALYNNLKNYKMENKNVIYSLQALRIFAAFIVLLFHIIYIYSDKVGTGGFESLFNFGKSGVHLFFVLSGYVMYLIHKKDIGKGLNIGKSFAWKRFIRIYPTYWIITSVIVVSMFFLPGEVKAYKFDFWYIFQSYSLVEAGFMDDGNPILTVAWSLFHEIKFYTLFFLLIVIKNKKIRSWMIYLVILLTLVNSFDPMLLGSNHVVSYYFSGLNFLFLFGIISAWIVENYRQLFKSRYYVFISIIAYAAVCLLSNLVFRDESVLMDLLFGLSSFMVITSLACYERAQTSEAGKSPFKMGKGGMLMADATYALYLIHIPIYIIVFKINTYLGLPDLIFIGLLITAAISASLIYYKAIEYPVINILRKIKGKRKAPTLVSEKADVLA